MFTLISPQQFKQIPWKNGKGMTTELAISEGGDLADFDWRLSIASVVENGAFSNFSGIQRYLFLLDGNGVNLEHHYTENNKKEVSNHFLSSALDLAVFDGGWQTEASLINGPITDFNLMVKQGVFTIETQVLTEVELVKTEQTRNQSIKNFPLADINFVYVVKGDCQIVATDEQRFSLETGHLLKIEPKTANPESQFMDVFGEQVIVIGLKKVCTNPAEE